MIKVFHKGEQKFVTNGLVVLDNCKSLYVTEELNGSYELEMEYEIDSRGKWQYLAQDNIIEADGQLFRIYHPNKKDFNTISINARHIFYDLLDNLVKDIDIRGLSGAAALEKVMSNLAYVTGFTWISDITAQNNIYLDDESGDIVGKNPVDAIMFLLNTYAGELVRDNFNIKMLEHRGQDRGMLISYGKNIKGIEEDKNTDSVVTRIKPIGQDGLYLPEEFVDSPHIGDYAHPKIAQIEFSDCNDYDSLRQAAKDYFTDNKCDIPQYNLKVDFVELKKTEEYKNYAVLEEMYLGDTVTVRVKTLNIDVKCKVIKIKKNILTDRIEEIELGNFKKNIAESINKAQQVADVFGGAIANGKLTKSFLQSWVDNATDLIIKSNGGHVVQDENGISIMDTKDKATAQKVWRWNLGGLGYSSTGYNGPYGTAITSDGKINADYVTAGELNGAILKANSVKTSALEIEAQQEIEKGKFSYDQLSVLGVGLDNKVSLGEVVLVPKKTKLQVSRAGPVISPLNAYNFTGGTAVSNNTLVTMQGGSNDYNYSAELEIYGDTQVTYSNPNDRIITAETEIKQQGDTISLVAADGAIKGAAIVSAINVSGAKIDMSALNINLSGYVTFNALSTAGSTTINGSNITTGQINADLIKAGTISGDRISGGTITGVTIVGGAIQTAGSQYILLSGSMLMFKSGSNIRLNLGFDPASGYGYIDTGSGTPIVGYPGNLMIGTTNNSGSNVQVYANGFYVNCTSHLQATDMTYGTISGAAIATQSWVNNQVSNIENWALTSFVRQANGQVILPNGMSMYCDGTNIYFYDASGTKIFGFNAVSCAGVVPDHGYVQLAAK